MFPFWLIIGLAGLVLAVYLVLFVSRGTGTLMLNGPLDPGSRSAVPPAMIEPVAPPGDPVQLLALRGDVVVLHFWASWCPPCREEFPSFAKYATSAKVPGGVDIFAISLDEDSGALERFLKAYPKGPVIFKDPEGLADQLKVRGIPATILLDKAGRVAWRSSGGGDWTDSGVPALVEMLRKE